MGALNGFGHKFAEPIEHPIATPLVLYNLPFERIYWSK